MLEAEAVGDEVADAEESGGYEGNAGGNGPKTASGKGEGGSDIDCLGGGFGTMDLELGDGVGGGLLLKQVPGGGERIVQMKATIDTTAARLTDERGLVYRYLAHDGLAGEEGTFLLCTFWLAQAQALAGELDQATTTFGRAVAAINDVGLLAEEVDGAGGEMIGNFPQAFSHIGLINAAWAISQAQERAADAAKGQRS